MGAGGSFGSDRCVHNHLDFENNFLGVSLMSKLIKLYILNMYILLHVKYISIKLKNGQKKKKNKTSTTNDIQL